MNVLLGVPYVAIIIIMLQISIHGEVKGWIPWLEVLMLRTMHGNTATVVLMS